MKTRNEQSRRGEIRRRKEDLTPLSDCCGFDRLVVLLGSVEFCPRVTVKLGSSVLPAG